MHSDFVCEMRGNRHQFSGSILRIRMLPKTDQLAVRAEDASPAAVGVD